MWKQQLNLYALVRSLGGESIGECWDQESLHMLDRYENAPTNERLSTELHLPGDCSRKASIGH